MDAVVALTVIVVLVIGVTTLLWTSVALLRLVCGRLLRVRGARSGAAPGLGDVAVLVAAHNEALVIGATIASARRLLPASAVFVVSDGSHDGTAAIARDAGAHVLELNPNRGKAGALVAGIAHFRLDARYEVVLLLDADTQLSEDYLSTGLRLFADPGVVAVAGRATTLADPPAATRIGRILVAYRERLYVAVQYLHKFGQAAQRANAVSIVPGFASMYRARVLSRIDIDARGLAIEDYNMTFEVHAKRLGRIAFHPHAAIARTQDPDTLPDYIRQVRRWNLGFWQTVRRHGPHVGTFWFALALYVVELVSSSVLLVLFLPLIAVTSAAPALATVDGGEAFAVLAAALPPWVLLVGVCAPDYALTVLAAAVTRRPGYLALGVWFPLLRILDAAICLRALWTASAGTVDGRWRSPTRRAVSV